MNYNYNTDVWLWRNASKSKDTKKLTVVDGHVYGKDGCLARFDDDTHAIGTLEQAGYQFAGETIDALGRKPRQTVMQA